MGVIKTTVILGPRIPSEYNFGFHDFIDIFLEPSEKSWPQVYGWDIDAGIENPSLKKEI